MIGVRPMLIVPLERLFESKVRLQDMASAGKRRTLPRNLLSSDAGLHLGPQLIREVRKLLLLCVDEIAIVSIHLVGALHEGHVVGAMCIHSCPLYTVVGPVNLSHSLL